MPPRSGRPNNGFTLAAPATALSCSLRAAVRALRHWWAEERHYRPERRYMRG